MQKKNYRSRGMTLVELLIASTISAVVLASLFISLGNVYFSQKKINATQSFALESRFFMERVTQLIRNNAIDYDRFFLSVGPDSTLCANFDQNQVPEKFHNKTTENCACNSSVGCNNDYNCRNLIGYENFFYWNIVPVVDERTVLRYRNLGGKKPNPDSTELNQEDVEDPCVQAWHEVDPPALPTPPPHYPYFVDQNKLYLINKERTERIDIMYAKIMEKEQTRGVVAVIRELGVDTTKDGIADQWGASSVWDKASKTCTIYSGADAIGPAIGALDEQACSRAYGVSILSPKAMDVVDFEIIPSPTRDPFLSYRIDEAQVQPHVFLRIKTRLLNPEQFGLDPETVIELTQQTTASSRVFGDIR